MSHINHSHEINYDLYFAIQKLKFSSVMILNQSVLLKNINDNVKALKTLSNSLFDAGILPYYLHVLDRTQNTAHFFVSDKKARKLIRNLLVLVSGYLVPRLVREISGELSKIPLDLQLHQN